MSEVFRIFAAGNVPGPTSYFLLMRKVLFILALVASAAAAQAQSNLSLMGRFVFSSVVFGDLSWDYPMEITFRADGTCSYTDRRGTLECQGVIVSEDKDTIHLFAGRDFGGSLGLTMVNLRFGGIMNTAQDGCRMRLGLYGDSSSYLVELTRTDDGSSVRDVTRAEEGGDMYGLDGVRTDTPSGVYIQDGVKKTAR